MSFEPSSHTVHNFTAKKGAHKITYIFTDTFTTNNNNNNDNQKKNISYVLYQPIISVLNY